MLCKPRGFHWRKTSARIFQTILPRKRPRDLSRLAVRVSGRLSVHRVDAQHFPPLPIHARRPTNASIVASSPGPTARQPLCSAVRMGTGSLTRRPCPVSCSDACRSASCKGRTHTLALLVGAWNSLQLQRIFACIDFWNFTFVLLLVCVLFFFQNSWSWSVYVRFNVGLIGWPVCAGNLNLCPDFVSWLQCENGVNVFEIFASFVAFLSTWSRT